jgi:dihydrofolate reductase
MSRKIILGVAVTMDGMIEGPNGEYDWCFMDQDYGMKEFMHGIDAVLYGRKSYELLIRDFGDKNPFSKVKTYVVSNTLSESPAYTLLKGNIEKQLTTLKAADGKNIWLFGGAELSTSLFKARLVDELWLSVHPILLGKGKRLFPELDTRTKLKLTNCKEYETGLVSLTYSVLY